MANKTMPACNFSVEWGGNSINCSVVSGLEILIDTIDEREGADPGSTERKIPSLKKYANVIFKRPITAGDNDFFNWLNNDGAPGVDRRDLTISLLDETRTPKMVWTIMQAFPVHYSGPILNAKSEDIAMEELEIVHEGLSVMAS